MLAAHIRGAFQRPTGNLPQGGGCKKAGGGAGRRASFDAPHRPLSVQHGIHWWACKQGDKRCLQTLKAPNPLSWLAREPFQHSSPTGRPLHPAGRRAPGSVSRRPCPSSQPGPPGADIGPSALCILFHRFSHNLDKAAYSSPKAAIINYHKGGICEGSSHSFPVASLGALRGSPPVWLAEVWPTPRERLRETRAEVTPGHSAHRGVTVPGASLAGPACPPHQPLPPYLGSTGPEGKLQGQGAPLCPPGGPVRRVGLTASPLCLCRPGIVRASSVFPILSTILLLLGGLCIGAGRFYSRKNNIVLSAGILFVAAGELSARVPAAHSAPPGVGGAGRRTVGSLRVTHLSSPGGRAGDGEQKPSGNQASFWGDKMIRN